MKRVAIAIIVIVVAGAIFLIATGSTRGAKQPKRIVFTAEQNKPLNEIDVQLKQLEQQKALINARATGLLDAYAQANGLAKWKMIVIADGQYGMEETLDAEQSETPKP
ncbi:MAG: hypothetical protein WBV94_33635 [Blastocatellia bacterium]